MKSAPALAPMALAVLVFAGCRERPPPSVPSEASPEAHPDDPRVVSADPEAVNYTPPGWPLEIGDTVTEREFEDLCWAFCESRGLAVVWVAGDSGTPLPFSASFAFLGDEYTPVGTGLHVYVGHDGPQAILPGYGLTKAYGNAPTTRLPSSLRKTVETDGDWSFLFPRIAEVGFDRWDAEEYAWWKAEEKRGDWVGTLKRHRERYYGPDASW